jgi:hypothetical protein
MQLEEAEMTDMAPQGWELTPNVEVIALEHWSMSS